MMYRKIIAVFFFEIHAKHTKICEEKVELYAKPDGQYGNRF